MKNKEILLSYGFEIEDPRKHGETETIQTATKKLPGGKILRHSEIKGGQYSRRASHVGDARPGSWMTEIPFDRLLQIAQSAQEAGGDHK